MSILNFIDWRAFSDAYGKSVLLEKQCGLQGGKMINGAMTDVQVTERDRDPAVDFVNGWCDQAWSTAADKLSKIIAEARAEGFAAGVARALELEPHLGYEPDHDVVGDGYIRETKWYCRGRSCGQPFGEPHLDNCEVAAAIRARGSQP